MNNLSKDENIALALATALVQARPGEIAGQHEIEAAYETYKQLKTLIANSPESRSERGFAS